MPKKRPIVNVRLANRALAALSEIDERSRDGLEAGERAACAWEQLWEIAQRTSNSTLAFLLGNMLNDLHQVQQALARINIVTNDLVEKSEYNGDH